MSVVLSEHLPLLASAPDGIQKLRGLILSLAMIGKLTEADTRNWALLTFDDLGEWGSGGTPLKAHTDYYGGDIPWLVIGDLNDGVVTSAETHITQKGLENSSAKLVPPGTLLIAMYGSIGKLGIAGIECATNQAIAHCRVKTAKIECRFLFYYVRAIRGSLLASGQGLAQQNISQKILKATPIQLPPLAEQHRIVAKVDELMALCDRLEAEQADADTAHAKLVETLLGTLTQSADAAELAANWQRLAEHFDTLFTTESSLDALKQSILQLAVMGKLVPQDPNDEPASELLKRIAKERARREAEGACKQSKAMPPVGADEQPFALPKGWVWLKFGTIVDLINGDRSKNYPNREEYVPSGVAWINTGHIEPDGTLSTGDMHFITREKFDSLRSGKIEAGDLVYCLRGATFGKTAFVTPYKEGAIASSLVIVRPHLPDLKRYLFLYLTSPFGRSQIFRFDNGSAQPNLSANSVTLFAFPLPPLAEQHRIVAKVDELMALCERLKADLIESHCRQERLASTLIKTALEAA